jgi:hypothetical protein
VAFLFKDAEVFVQTRVLDDLAGDIQAFEFFIEEHRLYLEYLDQYGFKKFCWGRKRHYRLGAW